MKIVSTIPKKTLSLYFVFAFVSLLSYFLLLSPRASAATTYEWQGDKIIQTVDDGTKDEFFKNGKHDNNLFSFDTLDKGLEKPAIGNSTKGTCPSHIDITIGTNPTEGKYYEGYIPTVNNPSDRKCDYKEAVSVTISNTAQGDKNLNKDLGLKECPNGPDGKANKSSNYDCLGGGAVIKGKYDKNGTVNKQDPANEGKDEEKPVDNEAGCDNALAPFGWVLCPVMNIADGFYSWFKDLISGLLFFESDKYTDNGLYDSWKTMVTIANSIIVLVAIVMIAAQIFNFEVFSAYTVKKALPRIIIAAILIQLSWFMVTTGIQVVNAIGSGLYWLLVAPFAIESDGGGVLEIGAILGANAPDGGASDAVGNTLGLGFVTVAMAGAVAGAILTGAWMSIVIMAIGVVISLVVAVITLLLREAVLIVLIAIAPIAIALWILPGTSSIWSLWWKTFSRLLLMYPLIMLLFAGGTISAILLSSSESYINYIFAIVAYFIPVFLIGATYKFAGSTFASMANFTGKMGGKVKSGGMFGLRDRAKFKKENSSWAMNKSRRENDRQRLAQQKYANTLTDSTSAYGKFLRKRAGVSKEGRLNAQANAGATIIQAKEQTLKDRDSLATFQVEKMVDQARQQAQENNLPFDRYSTEVEIRSGILKQADGTQFQAYGLSIDATKDLKQDVAIQALRNKDGTTDSTGIQSYLNNADNFQGLKDYGTENSTAYSVLAEKLPSAAKGAEKPGLSLTTDASGRAVFNNGFDDAVKNYASLAAPQQKEVALALGAALKDPTRQRDAANMLTSLARSNLSTGHAKILNDQLSAYNVSIEDVKNRPNAYFDIHGGQLIYQDS